MSVRDHDAAAAGAGPGAAGDGDLTALVAVEDRRRTESLQRLLDRLQAELRVQGVRQFPTQHGPACCEVPGLGWVNTLLGNVKRAIDGSYHACASRYAGRYLAEFAYRFNRRYELADLVPRLVDVAVRTPPLPERLLTLAGTQG